MGARARSKTLLRQIKVSSAQYIYFKDSWNEEDTGFYLIRLIRILIDDYLMN